MRYDTSLFALDRLRAPAKSGTREQVDRVLSILPSGVRTLVESGKTSIYDRIQAAAASVDLSQLVARYERGDTQALDRTVGNYVDVSSLPADLRETIELARTSRDLLLRLTPEQLDALSRGDFSVFGDGHQEPPPDKEEVTELEP